MRILDRARVNDDVLRFVRSWRGGVRDRHFLVDAADRVTDPAGDGFACPLAHWRAPGFTTVNVLPIEHELFRFYHLVP